MPFCILGTVAFGLRQQFSSHLQHLGLIVLTSLNRHETHNHKSTEDDNVSIPYHQKLGAQHCFERNTAFDRNDALRIVLGHGTGRINLYISFFRLVISKLCTTKYCVRETTMSPVNIYRLKFFKTLICISVIIL
jgi:hypothetical protein